MHDTPQLAQSPSFLHIFAAFVGGAVLLGGGWMVLQAQMPGETPEVLAPATAADREVAARLEAHVRRLAGPRTLATPGTLPAAFAYIGDTLRGDGLSPRSQAVASKHGPTENLEVVFPARGSASDAAPIVVLGAHVDTHAHSKTPGADDNASGTAVLLELARRLAAGEPAALLNAREVRVVFYTNEEPPYFNDTSLGMGSAVHARALREEKRAVAYMLSIESVGVYSDAPGTQVYPLAALGWLYPDRGNFVTFVGDSAMRPRVRQLVGAFRAEARLPSQGLAADVMGNDFSDHRSYREVGIPALMVTGTANLRGPTPGPRVPVGLGFAKHAHTVYHTERDTPDQLNYVAMAQLTDGLVRMLGREDGW